MLTEAITLPESRRLIALECTIKSGQQTFVEVGNALSEIRDSKLYRADFKTFEDYCREKWGWEKAYCNHLVRAAAVVAALPERTATIVATESQARALSNVAPSKRVEVIEKAIERGPITAKSIKEAAQGFYEPGINSLKTTSKDADVADQESDSFFQLKRWWKKATKKDRKKFLRWVKSNGE